MICRVTLSKSLSTVFILLTLVFFSPFYANLISTCTEDKKTVISASNEEHLAFLLHLTKCRVTAKNIIIFGHNNTRGSLQIPHLTSKWKLQIYTTELSYNHHRTKESAKLGHKYESQGTRLFKSTVAFLLQFMILAPLLMLILFFTQTSCQKSTCQNIFFGDELRLLKLSIQLWLLKNIFFLNLWLVSHRI